MYVWVAARFYFLLSFVDAYSRYVVHHKLLMSLDGRSVAVELQAALEAVSGAKPRVVHDHGSEFVNRDVAAVIKTHNLIDIKTRPRHPESNGIVERFNGTVRARERRRLWQQLSASRGDHRQAHAPLQRGAIARCLGLHDTGDLASWASRMKFETSVRGESLRPVRIVK